MRRNRNEKIIYFISQGVSWIFLLQILKWIGVFRMSDTSVYTIQLVVKPVVNQV